MPKVLVALRAAVVASVLVLVPLGAAAPSASSVVAGSTTASPPSAWDERPPAP